MTARLLAKRLWSVALCCALTPAATVLAQATVPLATPVDASRRPAAVDPTTAPAVNQAPEQGQSESTQATVATARLSADPTPLDNLASITADYRIGPNDLLEFDVFGVPDMKRDVRVNSSGIVSLPLIGPVQLAGLTAQEAEAKLAELYGKDYLQNPQVSIFIKEFTTQRITIEGAVNKPGIYPVTGQITLLRALALAGGQGQLAKLDEVMLYRVGPDGQQKAQVFDLEKVRAGEQPDPILQSDDVVVVKRDPRRTAVRDSLFRDIIGIFNPFSN
jgi:polysaccharide export outer membrane protein